MFNKLKDLPLDWFQWLMLGLAAATMVYQLAIPPIIGVADNGDWSKITNAAGLKQIPLDTSEHTRYFTPKLAYGEPGWRGWRPRYWVSGRVFARIAAPLGRLVSRDGLFDMRVIGFLHALTLLVALGLVMAGTHSLLAIPRRLTAVLLVFVFTDVGYIAFLNTFYAQAESLIFLIMTAGFFALALTAQRFQRLIFLGFVISAIAFATSKPQEAPQVLILSALAMALARFLRLERPLRMGVAAALLMLIMSAGSYLGASTVLKVPNLFNVVFFDVLRYSPDPMADMAALNLPPDWFGYVGKHAFVKDTPLAIDGFQQELLKRVGFSKLLAFYLTRPSRLWAHLSRRATSAFTLINNQSHFSRESGIREGTHGRLRFWSDFKKRVVPGSVWTLIAIFIVHLGAAVRLWVKHARTSSFRLGLMGFAALNLMATGAFLIASMGDGPVDVIRQLYAFNAMTDLMLITDAAFVTQAIASRARHSFRICDNFIPL